MGKKIRRILYIETGLKKCNKSKKTNNLFGEFIIVYIPEKSSKIVRILLTLKGNGDIVLLVLDITSQKTSGRFCFFDKKESSKREKNT